MPSTQELLNRFNDLKTLPHVVVRVTELAASDTSTMQDFEEVIKLDPVLVSKLLRLVNSSYFGLPTKIESISKAVVFAGMKNLRNLVAVEGLRDLFRGKDSGVFSREKLWFHSATVAILSDMIAKRIFGLKSEDIFLAGIMHDIGLIIEDQGAGELLRLACEEYASAATSATLPECEKKHIGTDHCELGHALAREWRLDEQVADAIKNHHARTISPVKSARSILQVAEYIACRMDHGAIADRREELAPHLAQHVKNMKAEYRVIIRDLPGEMAKAEELYYP